MPFAQSSPALENLPPRPTLGTPRIAILNAGGTIGGEERPTGNGSSTRLGDQSRLHRAVINHIDSHLQDFSKGGAPGTRPRREFRFDWLSMTKGQRIFSENAEPEHWCQVIERLQEYLRQLDEPGDLRAVIILYGTDTMAFAVPAMQFALQFQQIPIVFVGSNFPLLYDQQDEPLSLRRSDAWGNLLNAIWFCAVADHLEPQVLLSFNDVLHHALNLRKIHESAITSIESPRSWKTGNVNRGAARALPAEAYVFQNVLSHSKYLARDVHGHYVFTDPPRDQDQRHQRSIAQSPLLFRPHSYNTTTNKTTVAHVLASVSPMKVHGGLLSRHKAILVETYESGTIPTEKSHPFYSLLRGCAKKSIPIYLSSHYGIDTSHFYDAAELEKLNAVVFRINNLIPETALPLLLLACEQVSRNAADVHGAELGQRIATRMERIVNQTRDRTGQLIEETRVVRLAQ